MSDNPISTSEIPQVWDPAVYDHPRRRLIPAFELFYGRAAELVAASVGPTPAILDLGAGTGLLAAAVLERLPEARMTLLDGSAAMLAVARRRFGDRGSMSFQVGRPGPGDTGGAVGRCGFGAGHPSLSDESKRYLFAGVLAGLRPGGIFVNAEQVAAPPHGMRPDTTTSGEPRPVTSKPPMRRSPPPACGWRPIAVRRSTSSCVAGRGWLRARRLLDEGRSFCGARRLAAPSSPPSAPASSRPGRGPRSGASSTGPLRWRRSPGSGEARRPGGGPRALDRSPRWAPTARAVVA